MEMGSISDKLLREADVLYRNNNNQGLPYLLLISGG